MSLRFADVVRAVFIILAVAALAAVLTRRAERAETGHAVAIDGDSLRMGGVEMRLRGIDAPEYAQTCRRGGAVWPCGRLAAERLRRLLARGPATCIGDRHDLYGRLLVSCRVLGVEVNAEMVRTGYAVAYGGYAGEEAEARADARGVWAGPFERPEAWRKAHPRPAHQS